MPKCHSCAWHEYLRDHCELEPGYPNGCDTFRPKVPTRAQVVLCVGGILGVQGLMIWMDQASNSELTWAGLAVVVFWIGVLWLRRRN